jgi:hypothetical protein
MEGKWSNEGVIDCSRQTAIPSMVHLLGAKQALLLENFHRLTIGISLGIAV